MAIATSNQTWARASAMYQATVAGQKFTYEPKGKAAQEMTDLYSYISIALKGGRKHEEKRVSRRA